jgi:hypothetical protein
VDGRLARLRERLLRRRFYRASVADPGAIVELAVRPVLELQEECRRRGAAFGVVMIPERSGATRFDDAFRSRLEAAAVPLLDLAGVVGPSEYFRGDGHWNAEVHAVAARAVAAFVERTLVEPSRAGDGAAFADKRP